MNEIVSFGEWVQQRRNQLRYSRPALAHKIGCSPDTIKKIERDERRPSTQIAELLAQHLHLPASEKDSFMRRARGEFVARFGLPDEVSLAESQVLATGKDSPKHNLPPQTTRFIGRKRELANIGSQLAKPACRLLTILGAGGMGKTRLSLEAATAQIDNFTDGVTHVALASVAETTAINPLAGALADALSIAFHGGDSLEQQLFAYLRRKEMLIVFDNIEHLVETAVFLSDLLQHAPDIKILTTSRERLNLQEEWLLPLQGLPFSNHWDEQQGSAVHLFQQRAQQIKPTFDLEMEQTAVLQICRLVEGMPLALELAATWVRQMPCAEIAVEIKTELDFLTARTRNVPERHRSIRALFSYSWQQMTNKERMVLQRLSVFRGGFEREAAQAVANASLSLLQSLVDKSLLTVSEQGRYDLHELLRQFAAEKLSELIADEMDCHHLHCQYFLSLVAAQEPLLKGDQGFTAMRIIELNIENIRQAIHWGLNNLHRLFDRQVGISLYIFFENKAWHLEGETLFGLIADKWQAHCQSAVSGSDYSTACILQAQYQSIRGTCQLELGLPHKAAASHQKSLEILAKNNLRAYWTRSWCLLHLGNAIGFIDGSPYEKYYQECAETIHLANDPWLQGIYLTKHGQRVMEMGSYEQAQRLLDQSISIFEGLNARIHLTRAKITRVRLACCLGNLQLAREICQINLEEQEQLGLSAGVAWSYINLGKVNRLQGNQQQANDYYQRGLLLSQEINLLFAQALAWFEFGKLALATGDFDAADNFFQKSKQIMPLSEFAGGSGFAAIGLGDFDRAACIFYNMLQSTMASGIKKGSLEAIVGFAYLKAQAKHFDQAIVLLSFVKNHPSVLFGTKVQINNLWDELIGEVPPDQFAEAEARGKEMGLEKTAVSLLAEQNSK